MNQGRITPWSPHGSPDVAVQPAGNIIGHTNEVTAHQARLVLTWVTFMCIPSWYVASHSGQLSCLSSAGWEMNTGQAAVA